ncbi:DnaJ domain-containing protein [Dechloromonas sp. XY25]|uniref:DnaJ domain-containing protein n=1 Tax=Dechloromonas hankyongensis TaxID=2908002 RepID=A0ABS9JXK7_9RHOO|nr:DnaJ domain-containing protein [Dechloromonas hankyongensis]MCG2575559.1 DnaJ domain-containing protein [Dechloromonas hankyongensis]
MTQKTTYYDLLGVAPEADLEAISAAYLRLSREIAGSEEPEDAVRLQVIKRAFDVLSDPARRADYDAGLRAQPNLTFRSEMPGEVEAMLGRSKRNPVRMLLTIIATLMIVGLVLQVGVMFNAYKRLHDTTGGDTVSSPAADKVYLQDFYQTYGIRAASREEAELLLADMRRKEAAGRDADNQRRQQEEQERNQKRFEEESRRLGAQVTAANQYAEEQAQRAREEEARRKEAQEKAQQDAERMKRESEIARFRGRGVQSEE